tara:strand:+ start:293 stop:544 length:252 start_codon:yes stop_codon:yes gene_type:complete
LEWLRVDFKTCYLGELTVKKTIVKIFDDDSIEVTGNFELVDDEGNQWNHHGKLQLCRCGHSKAKPFCDNRHAQINFQSKVRVN